MLDRVVGVLTVMAFGAGGAGAGVGLSFLMQYFGAG